MNGHAWRRLQQKLAAESRQEQYTAAKDVHFESRGISMRNCRRWRQRSGNVQPG
jgi:hypothetical protein